MVSASAAASNVQRGAWTRTRTASRRAPTAARGHSPWRDRPTAPSVLAAARSSVSKVSKMRTATPRRPAPSVRRGNTPLVVCSDTSAIHNFRVPVRSVTYPRGGGLLAVLWPQGWVYWPNNGHCSACHTNPMGSVRARVTWPCYVIASGSKSSHYPSRPNCLAWAPLSGRNPRHSRFGQRKLLWLSGGLGG